MNGGTSLRAEGTISRLAVSSIMSTLLLVDSAFSAGTWTLLLPDPAPLPPHFCGQSKLPTSHNKT